MKNETPKKDRTQRTEAAHAGINRDPAYGAVAPPLYTSTTYSWPNIENRGPYDYGRTNNPTRQLLSEALTALEGGAGGVVTNSGMAAIDLCLNLLNADDLILAPYDCYGGTHRLLTHRAAQGRIKVQFLDQTDETALKAGFARAPKMAFIETPSNPLMHIADIEKIAGLARRAGALSVCDNTFLSPARQLPLALGCDIALHSTTKYINGHSDSIGGAVIAADDEIAERLCWWANCAGLTGAPFDAWLTLRGLRTLPARVDVQEKTAGSLADYLSGHDHVTQVYYPGLEGHPQAALIRSQQKGPGAMLSFKIKGDLEATKNFLSALTLFPLAASLGGTESLICQPAIMTHGGMEADARALAGITDNLIRISAGMESPDDLIRDLEKGFDALK